MRSTLALLRRCCRHAVIGVATLLVLLATLHAQPQADHCLGNAQACAADTMVCGDDGCPDAGAVHDPHPATPDDPDAGGHAGGHCHCPGPVTASTLPEPTRLPDHGTIASMRRGQVQAAIPDGRSYPPDPPPIRLN